MLCRLDVVLWQVDLKCVSVCEPYDGDYSRLHRLTVAAAEQLVRGGALLNLIHNHLRAEGCVPTSFRVMVFACGSVFSDAHALFLRCLCLTQ